MFTPNNSLFRYHLKPNDTILVDESRMPLYSELVREHRVEYHCGGDTLNVVKVAQWLMQYPRATAYIGCIGSFNLDITQTSYNLIVLFSLLKYCTYCERRR